MIEVPTHNRPVPAPEPLFNPAEILNKFMAEEVVDDVDLLMEAKEIMRGIGASIIDRHFDPLGRQTWRIRPSGQKCTRAEALKKLGFDNTRLASRGVFAAGDFGEAFTFSMMALTGKFDIIGTQLPLTLPGPGGTAYNGTLDILIRVGGKKYVIDVKTATAKGIMAMLQKNELKTGGDPWGYKRQLRTYMMSAEHDIAGGWLLYLNKEYWNQWVGVWVPPPSEEDKKRWFEHCQQVIEAQMDTLPPRPAWAETISRPRAKGPGGNTGCLEIKDMRCSYCGCVEQCWSDVGKFEEMRPKTWRADK